MANNDVHYSICCLRRPGGDRIYGVFDNQLPAALKKLPFDRHLSLQNVRKVISEADGYQPHLIAPEQGYRRLIDSSLIYFKGPAEASVDAVGQFIVFSFIYNLYTKFIHLIKFTCIYQYTYYPFLNFITHSLNVCIFITKH